MKTQNTLDSLKNMTLYGGICKLESLNLCDILNYKLNNHGKVITSWSLNFLFYTLMIIAVILPSL